MPNKPIINMVDEKKMATINDKLVSNKAGKELF